MGKRVEEILTQHYDFVANNMNKPEIIIDRYFGIEDLYMETEEINEEIFLSKFTYHKHPETFTIFHYTDFVDFVNTYCKIDPIDLYIYINEKDFQVFVLNFIKILNQALKYWILSKGSGFRKNTKLMLTYVEGKGEIKLEYIPDLKF